MIEIVIGILTLCILGCTVQIFKLNRSIRSMKRVFSSKLLGQQNSIEDLEGIVSLIDEHLTEGETH